LQPPFYACARGAFGLSSEDTAIRLASFLMWLYRSIILGRAFLLMMYGGE
jgi:hypothetical protein